MGQCGNQVCASVLDDVPLLIVSSTHPRFTRIARQLGDRFWSLALQEAQQLRGEQSSIGGNQQNASWPVRAHRPFGIFEI